MEAKDDEYTRKERIVLVTIVVFASLAIASVFVAFSYYCYIRNKVSKRLKTSKSKYFESFSLFFSFSSEMRVPIWECGLWVLDFGSLLFDIEK